LQKIFTDSVKSWSMAVAGIDTQMFD